MKQLTALRSLLVITSLLLGLSLQAQVVTIHVETPGTLSSYITSNEKDLITSLTLTGNLNGTDIRYIREMAGSDVDGYATSGKLSVLDISGANIVAGGDSYYYYYYSSYNTIGGSVFINCTQLTSMVIPNSVTSIGAYAFRSCSGLMSVTIGNSVTSIGDGAFQDCSRLTSVTIGNSVTSIGAWAFSGCSGLKDVICQVSKPAQLGFYSFYGVNITTCILWVPESATEDYSSAQVWNSFINIIEEGTVIEYDVTLQRAGQLLNTLGANNLKRVTKLTISGPINGTDLLLIRSRLPALRILDIENAIIVSGGVAYYSSYTTTHNQIGEYAFSGCSGLTSVTIPNGVTSIGSEAFRSCSGLMSVTIPNSVTSIGFGAFWSCSGLTSISIPNSVTSIGYRAFQDCSGLMSVTIPNSVTSIDGAFQDCSGLTSVTIPNGVTSIGSEAFYDCSGLKSVTIPNSVTSIGTYAFSSCSGLKSVIIGNGITSIGSSAFSGCTGLNEIHSRSTIPPIAGSNSFDEINKITCTLYIPKGSYTNYWLAAGWGDFWGDFANIIEEDITSNLQIQSDNIKVYTEAEAIVIEGAEPGETISIYTESGALIESTQSRENIVRLNAPRGHLYLIKTVGKTFKIAL